MPGLHDANFTRQQHAWNVHFKHSFCRRASFMEQDIELIDWTAWINVSVSTTLLLATKRRCRTYCLVDRSNVKLQLDLYHAQIMDGDLSTFDSWRPPYTNRSKSSSCTRKAMNHRKASWTTHIYLMFLMIPIIMMIVWIQIIEKWTEEGLGWVKLLIAWYERRYTYQSYK